MDTEGTGVANIMLKAVIAIAAILVVVLIFVGPGQKSSGPKQPAQSAATSEVDEIRPSKQPVKATTTPEAAEFGSTKQPVESAGTSGDKSSEPEQPQSKADYVFYNGKIYTVNEKQPWAEAVAVKDNKVVAVGSEEEVEKYVSGTTEVIDLDGRTMMPGFVSAHDHLISSNWTNAGVNLFSAETIEECLKLIKEYAEANPDHKVIKGIGWNVSNYGGVHPTAKQLDTAVPDRPAIILDFTIHDAWLNTKALNMANITKDTPDAVPGVTYWVRDDQGNPTGCAIEIQWMQAYNDVGAWEPKKMMKESADKLLTIAASNGTTTFLNPGVITPNIKDVHGGMETDFMAAMEMLTEMEKKGELKLRVNALPFFKSPDGDPKKFVAFAKKMSKKYNTDKIRVQSVKIHPEGNSTSAVAPFLEPYSHKDTKGAFNVKPEVTKAIFLEANKAGLDVIIHTDGDASTRVAVDAFEASVKTGYTDRRNALHHLIWTHPDDYKRLVDLKIPVNATPNFYIDWTGQGAQFTEYLGLERNKTELGRYSDLVRAGNHVSIAADVPSTMPNMQGALYVMQAAVTLMDPGSKDVEP